MHGAWFATTGRCPMIRPLQGVSAAQPRRTIGLSALERLAAIWLLLLVLFFALRVPAWGKYDPLPTGVIPGVCYLGIAALLLLVLRRAGRSSLVTRWASHTAILLLMLLFTGMAWTRVELVREVNAAPNPWPPRPERIGTTNLDSLSPLQRAAWGARIGGHVALDRGRLVLPLTVPPEWPLPKDVEFAVRERGPQEFELWSRVSDGTAVCQSILLDANIVVDSVARKQRCSDAHRAPSDLYFATPPRIADAWPSVSAPETRPAWLQYRADPARTARREDTGGTQPIGGWHTLLDGRIRASVSVAGDLVLVGGHGTGSLTALDRTSGVVRWIARVPNWVHQDPVTDGRIVLVGFGDNDGSFSGWAPSGVAAYDLATGARRWTAFDEGSVMTSPIIHDSVVIYGTGVGQLRQRSLASGALLIDRMLPGTVTMAPPVVVGDTVVFSLDHGMACALLIETLESLWCHEFPDIRKLGHASPTIANGRVFLSGVATVMSPSLAEFRELWHVLQWRLIRSALFPGKYEVYAGQVFLSLDLHDGHQIWRSKIFEHFRDVDGHTSGTATIEDSIAVIVLPVADTVVAFLPRSGATLWTASGHEARGPPLILDHQVIIAGRDGVIEIRDLVSGVLTCTVRRPIGWDRAGPVVSGGLVIFANLDGEIEAIPTSDLLGCTAAGSRLPSD